MPGGREILECCNGTEVEDVSKIADVPIVLDATLVRTRLYDERLAVEFRRRRKNSAAADLHKSLACPRGSRALAPANLCACRGVRCIRCD